MIKFILLINKQGQTRLAKYYFDITVEERMTLEGELVRKCLSRTGGQVNFLLKSSVLLWTTALIE